MAAFVRDSHVDGDLAHPPRWAAILDLCPQAAWPSQKRLTTAYLLHIEDGNRILLWGRLIFSDLSESVGFVPKALERRLQTKAPSQTRYLSRLVKPKTTTDKPRNSKLSAKPRKIEPSGASKSLRHTAPGALGSAKAKEQRHEQRIARFGQKGHGKGRGSG